MTSSGFAHEESATQGSVNHKKPRKVNYKGDQRVME